MRNRSIIVAAVLAAMIPMILLGVGNLLDPFSVDTSESYQIPSGRYLMGTDGLGRDMFARISYAAGLSAKVVLQSLSISFLLALLLGGLAGWTAGRTIDRAIMWVIALLYTVPFILIVVAVFAVIQPGFERAYLVIGCIGSAAPARLVREEVRQLKNAPFVRAERAFGFTETRILLLTILPLSFYPAFTALLYFVPELIGLEVGLSFFGLGAPPPTPALGQLIYDGLAHFQVGWWLSVGPALALLVLTTLAYTVGTRFNRKR